MILKTVTLSVFSVERVFFHPQLIDNVDVYSRAFSTRTTDTKTIQIHAHANSDLRTRRHMTCGGL